MTSIERLFSRKETNACTYCRDVEQENLSQYGGGVVLIGLHLILSIIYLVEMLAMKISFSSDAKNELNYIVILSSLLSYCVDIIMALLAMYAVFLFFKKKISFIKYYLVFIFSVLLYYLVYSLYIGISNYISYRFISLYYIFNLIYYPAGVVFFAIPYLKYSPRVKAIFVH